MSYPSIEELEVYNRAIEIAEKVFQLASKWERIYLNTMGTDLP